MESESERDTYSSTPEVYVTMDSFTSFDSPSPDLQILLKRTSHPAQVFIKYKGSGKFGLRRCYMSPSLHKLVLEKVAEENSRGHCILVEDIVFIETGFSTKLASALAKVNKSPMHHAIRITTNKAFIELSTDEKALRDNWAAALKSLVKASKEFHSAQGFRLYCNLRLDRAADEEVAALQQRQLAELRFELARSVLNDLLAILETKKPASVPIRLPKAAYKWLNYSELLALSQTSTRQRRQVQEHLAVLDSWTALVSTGLQNRSLSWCLFLRIFFAKTKFKRNSGSLSEESAELIDRDVNLGRIAKNVAAYNVLKAVCQHNPDVGYCQGMHLLADFLFRVMKHEKHVLGAMVVLMNPPYDLAEVFKPGFPKLKLLQYQLEILLKLKLPALRDHLKRVDLDLNTITAPWILTLFTNTSMQEEALRRLWDLFWVGNWRLFLAFLLAILNLSQEHVIGETMEGTIAWYATGLSDLNYTRAFALVSTYTVAEGLLADLEATYESN